MIKNKLFFLVFLIITIVFFFVSPTHAQAATYYVAGDTGSDSNDGSIGSPWKTIQKSADTMVAGDTVNVRGGVEYAETITPANSGSSGNYITYQAWAATGIPTISTLDSSGDIFEIAGKNYLVFSGFRVSTNTKGVDGLAGSNIIFKNNIFSDATWAITSLLDSDFKIYNNVFYNNYSGVLALSTGLDVKNNIFINNSSSAIQVGAGTITNNYNLFWNNVTNYSGVTAGANDITSDPLFENAGGGDFRLRPGSPAIDAGTTLSDVTDDILGVTRAKGDGYDIGAYEYFDYTPDLVGFSADTVDQKPSFKFKPGSSATSGTYTYKVELDPEKNRTFTESYIPDSSPDTSTSNFLFKDTDLLNISYTNWHDSDTNNNEISVLFKELNTKGGLTEGFHSWKVTSTDTDTDSSTFTQDFLIDLTKPQITSLTVTNPVNQKAFSVNPTDSRVYTLDITNRMPAFWGKVTDPLAGSTRHNQDGTTDIFKEGASGVNNVTLSISKLKSSTTQCIQANFEDYTEINLDSKNNEFFTKPEFPLINGTYQVIINTTDKAGNTYTHPSFYLNLVVQNSCNQVNQTNI